MSPLFSFLDQCSLSPSGFHLTWEPTTRRGRKQTDFALIQSPCRTFQRRNQSGSCPTQDPCHRYLTANPDNRKYRSSTCQSLHSQSTLHLVTKARGRQVNCICVAPCVHSAHVLLFSFSTGMQSLLEEITANPGLMEGLLWGPYVDTLLNCLGQNPDLAAKVTAGSIYWSKSTVIRLLKHFWNELHVKWIHAFKCW